MSDSVEDRKWFVNRIDSILQNWIELHQSDYDTYASKVKESEEILTRYRNGAWQVMAAVAALSVALIPAKVFPESALVDVIILTALIAVAWTVFMMAIRRTLIPRMGKVEESYKVARLALLDLQLWFQNSTTNVAKISRIPLDDYYDFIRVAVGSTFSTVLTTTEQFQKEMHIKPGDPLETPLQRLARMVSRGYDRYRIKRSKMRDTNVFPHSLLYLLDPYESRYQAELTKTSGAPPASSNPTS